MNKKKVTLSYRLDEILKEKKRGVRELARATGIGIATISRIVNNHNRGMSLDVLERLCEELDIEPQDIYKFEIKK